MCIAGSNGDLTKTGANKRIQSINYMWEQIQDEQKLYLANDEKNLYNNWSSQIIDTDNREGLWKKLIILAEFSTKGLPPPPPPFTENISFLLNKTLTP